MIENKTIATFKNTFQRFLENKFVKSFCFQVVVFFAKS